MTHDDLIAAYSAEGRHYHDLRHVEDCLALLDREILTLAIWWIAKGGRPFWSGS
jgi:predicted metal-dependent HD superfamily phosphohydrolase